MVRHWGMSAGARGESGLVVLAIAGNHVVIATDERGPYILHAHLQKGSVTVMIGDQVSEGAVVGACDNSGNSTPPHLHIQATDTTNWEQARGLPIAFRFHASASSACRVRDRLDLIPPSLESHRRLLGCNLGDCPDASVAPRRASRPRYGYSAWAWTG